MALNKHLKCQCPELDPLPQWADFQRSLIEQLSVIGPTVNLPFKGVLLLLDNLILIEQVIVYYVSDKSQLVLKKYRIKKNCIQENQHLK